MSVDLKTVKHVAHLARLTLTEEGAAAMTKELNAVLDWGAQLEELDTTNVEPTISPVASGTSFVQSAFMRLDKVNDGNIRSDILSNAPLTEEGFFLVPKVVE